MNPDRKSPAPTSRRAFLTAAGASLAAGFAPSASAAGDEPAPPSAGEKPTVVRTRELRQREPGKHLWTLHQNKTSRTNLVEMSGDSVRHIHPDAEHSLYVLAGDLTALVGDETIPLHEGDYISIPPGIPHCYSVPPGKTALLLSLDAPAYDPAKIIRVPLEKK